MRATDNDIGSNAYIRYGIESPANVFHINETNGNITTLSVLDREKHSVYKINVSARDDGNVKLISYETVTVQLLDLNDHLPVLRNLPNVTYVLENIPTGTNVYQINAVDDDFGDNAKLSYIIISGMFSLGMTLFIISSLYVVLKGIIPK